MDNLIPLHRLPIGRIGKVKILTSEGAIRRRMLDLGIIQETRVKALRRSPSGDPTAYQIRDTVIALRSEEASRILVESV